MTLDGALFLVFLSISFVIGALASRSVSGIKDYFVAGARMPWFLIVGTFIASNVSAGTFLGATNMAGQHGYAVWSAFFTTSIGFVLGISVVGVLVRRMASHFEILDFTDILAVRYNSRGDTIRTIITIILPLVYIPMLAAQLIGLATIAGGVFELPYHTVLVAITLVVIVYTMLGGMLGVVWSDGFQCLVLIFGMLLALPLAMSAFGDGDMARGWEQLQLQSGELFNWTSSSWPWYVVLGQFVWIFAIPVQPHLVTRFLTAKNERQILIALPICLTVGLFVFTSVIPIGLLGQAVGITEQAHGYAYLAVAKELLGPWIGAFALAGIAAAALSTCSTILIVTGQSLSREIYQKKMKPTATERESLFAARACVVLVGSISLVLAITRPLGIFWLVVLSASLLASTFFVPIMAGFFIRKAGAVGAIASMISGATAAIVVFSINKIFDSHYFISEVFAGILAATLAMYWANRKYPATAEERQVLKAIDR